jgi:hypothetical protein
MPCLTGPQCLRAIGLPQNSSRAGLFYIFHPVGLYGPARKESCRPWAGPCLLEIVPRPCRAGPLARITSRRRWTENGARTNGGLGPSAPAAARVEVLPGLWRARSRRGRPGWYRSTPLLLAFGFLVSATQLDLTASLHGSSHQFSRTDLGIPAWIEPPIFSRKLDALLLGTCTIALYLF